jgi:hypothetical protein
MTAPTLPKKRGRKPLAPEDKKQNISITVSPDVAAAIRSDGVLRMAVRDLVERYVRKHL